ncbi:MFS transporter [Dermacoccaceae bacterium W4C1]
MSPHTTFRALFALTGPWYIVGAFLARIPLAMSQLGVLMLVAAETGSYGAGGACAGALAVANAVGATAWGSLADRIGQRLVLVTQSLGASAALVAVVILAGSSLPWPVAAGACAVTGLLLPQVGPLARARWRPIAQQAGREELVDVAFSYEGAADEASFVTGPALVGLLSALLGPAFALSVAAAVLAVFGTWFGLHPTARLTRPTGATRMAGGRLLTGALALLCLAQLSIGMVFGSVQNGTQVLATEAGAPGLTGLFHALLGVGSVVAGLSMGLLPQRWSLPGRLPRFAVAFTLLALPLPFVNSLAWLAPVLLVLGCTVAPYMITTFTLGERVTEAQRVGAAMTALAGATGLGYAIGAAASGRLADWGGSGPAFAFTVTAGVCMTAVAIAGYRPLRRAASPT